MAREWQPGDVALRIGLGGQRNIAVRVPACTNATSPLADRPHWHFADASARVGQCGSDEIADYRPLLVIDPEDREQVGALARESHDRIHNNAGDFDALSIMSQDALTDLMQDTARSLLDPKPAEPQGLGAVVRDREGNLWIRDCPSDCPDATGCIPWAHVETGGRARWVSIEAVTVEHEGWRP